MSTTAYWAVRNVPSKKQARTKCVSWIVWQDQQRPEVVGREMWSSPDVLRAAIREAGDYTEFPARDGGALFVKLVRC